MRYECAVPPLIAIQHVSYAYPSASPGYEQKVTPALHDVSLSIQPGEYVALLGHNGSGKSTLARHCNALLLPDSGRVLVDGMATDDTLKQPFIREHIGIIFQNPDNQLIATVVEDDIAWSLAVRGFPLPVIRERVQEAMAAVGITHLRHVLPSQLSGGQRQRVAIAGVLALRPRCIIADEASSMLDPYTRQEFTQLLGELHQRYRIAIIHVTHLLEEVLSAQRVVVMEHGQIVLEGTPTHIFSDLTRLQELGLVIPQPILLASSLRASGMPISPHALTLEAIANEVGDLCQWQK